MKLHSIRIKGFAGIPYDDNPVFTLAPLGAMNILIGPNNAGKSTVVRFLLKLVSWMSKKKWSLDSEIETADCWRYEPRLSANIVFECDDQFVSTLGREKDRVKLALPHLRDANGNFELEITLNDKKINIIPKFFDSSGVSGPLLTIGEVDGSENFHVDDGNVFSPILHALLPAIGKTFVFFDPIRALDRSGNKSGMEDGSGLLKEMWELQTLTENTQRWARFRNDLMIRVNRIFIPLGIPEVKHIEMKHGHHLHVIQVSNPDISVPINQLGMGISQIFILLAIFINRSDENIIACIEEPESNLHPGLLRRFMDELRRFQNVQFIATTHSHVLLDCLEENDKVFRLHQEPNGGSSVELCEGIRKKHSLLDALGIRASSLLQANCVIWVEGPSDRLYIRQWLKEVALDLLEGRDFTFNYYGGTLLAHLELNAKDELANDFVSMLWISRVAIVVMDSDLAPGESKEKLAPRKKPIIEAAEKDSVHRLAVVTNGRDIENDIPQKFLLTACATILGCEPDKLKNAEIKGVKGFEHEFVSVLAETVDDRIKAMTRKLGQNKITIAMKIVKMCDETGSSLAPPEYVKQMVDLIRRVGEIKEVART